MVNQVRLYISAAADLERERDLLGRSVSEIPVQLGWLIHQTPRGNDHLDSDAVVNADIHLLLISGDIRAPVGLEWYRARRAGRYPALFLRNGIQRTRAAEEFIYYVGKQASWEPYNSRAELRLLVLSMLTSHIVDRAVTYGLSPSEMDTLVTWRAQLTLDSPDFPDGVTGGAGDSGQIYSTERYVPSTGILLDPEDKEGSAREGGLPKSPGR
jgi:hypothetical protein